MEEFYNIFGPDLKAVSGDPKRINEVLCRVESLPLPVESVDFNPFDMCKMSSWKMIMHNFNIAVQVSLLHIDCRKHGFWKNTTT